jgi:hypothetical protein
MAGERHHVHEVAHLAAAAVLATRTVIAAATVYTAAMPVMAIPNKNIHIWIVTIIR